MSFFKRLFGGKKSTHVPLAESVGAPQEGGRKKIAYDPELVQKLTDDHKALFQLYTDICNASNNGKYAIIPELLADLKLAFQTHVMLENVKFYVYLQQHIADDSEMASFLSDIRKEMDGIARTLVRFVSTYSNINNFNEEKIDSFKKELAVIGNVLTKRVKVEEKKLYTLYLPEY